jgi:hypothetical protein
VSAGEVRATRQHWGERERYSPGVKRAEIVVDLDMATARPARATRSIADTAGVRGFSVEATDSFGGPTTALEKMRFRLPLSDADRVIATILGLPGVIDARIAQVDDYPPDDEPPAGVREPRRPHPPTGHLAAEADDG